MVKAPLLQKVTPTSSDQVNHSHRRKTQTVYIGSVPLGSDYPIRVQTMTISHTIDTASTTAEILRLANAGSEYVRLAVPSLKEAENLKNIKARLRQHQCTVPLIADIHFTPNAAELAARFVEKVRINPGNYVKNKRFDKIKYTSEDRQIETEYFRQKLIPLIKICKEYGTTIRIGVNHGSLSDRILSAYGDTALGMVESALEFIRICHDENYHHIVLSLKASNPLITVEANRLIAQRLEKENLPAYPLHLGVTEAGEGEDGRIKSAVGIGTLLEEGLGDTIRVSLTEDSEVEILVAQTLISRYQNRTEFHKTSNHLTYSTPYTRRLTQAVINIGGSNPPRVIADFVHHQSLTYNDLLPIGYRYDEDLDKWLIHDRAPDYIFTGDHPAPFHLPSTLGQINTLSAWTRIKDKTNCYPLLTVSEYYHYGGPAPLNFVLITPHDDISSFLLSLTEEKKIVLVSYGVDPNPAWHRYLFTQLIRNQLTIPVVVRCSYQNLSEEELCLNASVDTGALFIDGLGDGIFLQHTGSSSISKSQMINDMAFGILQATRTRISRTEYISCPSCGRTLFDLQQTTSLIRSKTQHLKGIKIGIMGCIVNGPGEMADADYGYVGSGPDRITLYRGKEVVSRQVPTSLAVDKLIELIREDGKWTEPDEYGIRE